MGPHNPLIMGETLDVMSRMPGIDAKFNYFADELASHGLTDVFFARAGVGRGEPIIIRRWNPEWAELYDAKNFRTWDQAMKKGRTADGPFLLRQPEAEIQSSKQREFYKAAEAYNRLNGFAVLFRSGFKPVSGLSATGLDRAPPNELILVTAAMGYVFNLLVAETVSRSACDALKVTEREYRLLRMMADGRTHVEVAKILGITEGWAHKSYAQLRAKLGVPTDPALIRIALEAGILT